MADFDLSFYVNRLLGLHDHICPRQVLGLRMSLYGATLLKLDVPQANKRMLAFVETDGCFADGVAVATGCTLGHRTLRLMDFGKVAVSLVDSVTGDAIRVAPRPGIRELAGQLAPNAASRWHAQLESYQLIPDQDLFVVKPVTLNFSLDRLISAPGRRVNCDVCGEEIINEREVKHEGMTLCLACTGQQYYEPLGEVAPQALQHSATLLS
jgi:formylmethanofuran dehydrogenase subunit E